jgi:hypothetical protein
MPNVETTTSQPPKAAREHDIADAARGTPDRRPLYRIVEVTRAPTGRLELEGKVWHTELDRVRRFGRIVAANTGGHKVLVLDGVGNVLEELTAVPDGKRTGDWQGWRQLALPALPPLQPRAGAAASKSPPADARKGPKQPSVASAPAPAKSAGADAPPVKLVDAVIEPSPTRRDEDAPPAGAVESDQFVAGRLPRH